MKKENFTVKLESDSGRSWWSFDDMELRKLYLEFTIQEIPLFSLILSLAFSTFTWLYLLLSIDSTVTCIVCFCYFLALFLGYVCGYAVYVFKRDQRKLSTPLLTPFNALIINNFFYFGIAALFFNAVAFGASNLCQDDVVDGHFSFTTTVYVFLQYAVPVAFIIHYLIMKNKLCFVLQLKLEETKAALEEMEAECQRAESLRIDMHHMIGEFSSYHIATSNF